ncbi:MAG: copper homeostasis protein CutC [Terracidiphilus sp.]|nr:copper homeostasis protein CutC [Terracidiphilus sp.]MDR3796988.1 copper homeostasis protein CutC [Terracidiphilus sp.]
MVFELCAETLEACLAGQEGGADRIELCTALQVDGLTPSHALIEQAVSGYGIPVHVMVRPHAGSFHYDVSAFTTVCDEVRYIRSVGAAGVVLGVLLDSGTVDIERTRALVQLAHPLEVTFHRAIDATPHLEQALEDVIAAGCHRVLTSGGAADVVAGSRMIARLVERASDRIAVAVGGGLRLHNAREVSRLTRAQHFHGSLPPEDSAPASLAERVRIVTRILRGE